MHKSREKGRVLHARRSPVFGLSLPWLIATMALAKTVPFTQGQFKTPSGQAPAANAECFENVGLRSLTVGERVLRLEDGRQRAPVHVRVTALDAEGREGAPIDQGADAPLALTRDVERPACMSALDAFSSFDLGRMVRGSDTHATRVQVFLSMHERDDDAFVDDASPELLVFGSDTGASLRVTPILDGTPDVPASLTFGTTRELPAELFAKGRLPVRIGFAGDMQANSIGLVGLDLSGDLGVGPGQSVVGYQIDLPAGSNAPVKVLASGQVEFGAYANFADLAPEVARAALGQFDSANGDLDLAEDRLTAITGPVFIGQGDSATFTGPEDITASLQPDGAQFSPNENLGFQDSGSWPVNPPPTPAPPAPVIPAPSVLTALAGLGIGTSRGRRRA